MSNAHTAKTALAIPPAYCFSASPTYNAWVKITATDVHALRKEAGFDGQDVYFYLNHPIRYVQLVGVVVAIENTAPTLAIVTIDDGSGATIDVKINRVAPGLAEATQRSSNTEVDNVGIVSGLGTFAVFVDATPLEIMTILKVKCTISVFRGTRQLILRRTLLVKTTDEELAFWASAAAFKRNVLAKPWPLDESMRRTLEDQAKAHSIDEAERKRGHMRKWQIYRSKLKDREEKLERQRKKEEIVMDAGALPGTDLISYP